MFWPFCTRLRERNITGNNRRIHSMTQSPDEAKHSLTQKGTNQKNTVQETSFSYFCLPSRSAHFCSFSSLKLPNHHPPFFSQLDFHIRHLKRWRRSGCRSPAGVTHTLNRTTLGSLVAVKGAFPDATAFFLRHMIFITSSLLFFASSPPSPFTLPCLRVVQQCLLLSTTSVSSVHFNQFVVDRIFAAPTQTSWWDPQLPGPVNQAPWMKTDIRG